MVVRKLCVDWHVPQFVRILPDSSWITSVSFDDYVLLLMDQPTVRRCRYSSKYRCFLFASPMPFAIQAFPHSSDITTLPRRLLARSFSQQDVKLAGAPGWFRNRKIEYLIGDLITEIFFMTQIVEHLHIYHYQAYFRPIKVHRTPRLRLWEAWEWEVRCRKDVVASYQTFYSDDSRFPRLEGSSKSGV